MPTSVEDGEVLLINEAIEIEDTDADASLQLDSPDQLQDFLDKEEEQLREKVETIADAGADVVLCRKGIGILAVSRVKKSDMSFLREVIDTDIVSDLDTLEPSDLGSATIEYSDDELFYVEGTGERTHGVTLLLRGSTEHVVDELERGIGDALEVVAQTVSDGRVLAGGGAIEIEVARRVREYADSVSGREQLAVESFADALELVPRVLAENAGLDSIDTLVDLRAAHDDGDETAGLNVFTGDVVDTFEAGVVESAHAKQQAISSATEAANLVLKIDDIIAAGDLSTEGEEDEGAGGPGGMGGMGGMGGGMGGMM